MFGAGCWAERLGGGRSVACSVSGQGELIVQSSLAKTLAERVATTAEGDTHDTLRSVLVDHFYSASLILNGRRECAFLVTRSLPRFLGG